MDTTFSLNQRSFSLKQIVFKKRMTQHKLLGKGKGLPLRKSFVPFFYGPGNIEKGRAARM